MGLIRQSAVTLAARYSITLINIPISMIIARVLGAEGQGIYSIATSLPGLWAGLGLLGLDAAHLYHLSRDRKLLGPVAVNSLLIVLALSVILVPAWWLLIGPILGERAETFRPYVFLSGVVVPLILARHLFLGIFLGLGRVEAYNALMVSSQVALLGLVAAGLLLFHAGTVFVVLSYALSLLVFILPSLVWLNRNLTKEDRARLRPDRTLFRGSTVYGLKGHLGVILTNFTYRFDTVLVSRWLGLASQGQYSIAVLLAEKLSHITASVQFVLFPRISSSSRDQANRITPLVCRQTLLWVALAGGVMMILSRFLLLLFFGSGYLPALRAFRILIPGIVVLTLSSLLTSDLSGRNRRFQPTLAMAAAFGVNLGLDFLLIRKHGIEGAALASSVAYCVQSVLMSFFFWSASGISPVRLLTPGAEDADLYRRMWARVRRRGEARGDAV